MAVGTTAFPTSLDTAVELVEITNNASSTLASNVSIGAATVTVADPSEFPTTGFATIVDDLTTPTVIEVISWTGKSGSDLTGVTKGEQGTSDQAWTSGQFIEIRPTKGHHEALRGAIIAIETKLGTGSAIAVNKLVALTASRALVSDASGFLSASAVTSTELGYVSGVTSAIQTQFSGKASTGAVTGSGLTMSTARLLGRSTASTGAIEEITVGSGLSLSAGTLTATGGGGGGDALTSNPLSQFAATTSAQLAGVISDETGSGALVFGTSPTLTTPVLGVASATSLAVTGTAGNGFVSIVAQSSAPGTPGSGFALFADSSGRFSWVRSSDGFVRKFDATLTADRTYTLPDVSGTVVTSGNLTAITATGTIASGTWNGSVIGSSYGGAGSVSGILKANGAGTVSAASAGTDYVVPSVTTLSSLTTVGTITSGGLGTGAVIGGVTMTLGSDGTGDIYYRSAGGVLTRLAAGTNGHVLTLSSGLPAWQAASGGGLTIGTTAIASGTVGRVLYEATGNVLGEAAGITYQTGASPTVTITAQAASYVGLRVNSASTPSANVFSVSADAGTTAHFAVTSTGAPSSPGAGASSERYGSGSTAAGDNTTVIGNGASASGQRTTVVGRGASSTSLYSVVIGYNASGMNLSQVIIGDISQGNGASSTLIGQGINSTGAGHNVAVGYAITPADSAITIGDSAVGAASSFVAGSSSYPMMNVYFGKGVTNATPTAYTINGTGGSGTNIAGAALNLAGGKGTGTGTGGDVNIQFARAGTTGSSLNSLSTIMAFSGTTTATTATQTNVNGATTVQGQITENITLNTGGTTTDSTIDLPANSIILSVTARITTTITTATDWSVGDPTTSDRFSSANSTLTAGTTSVGINQWKADRTTAGQGPYQASTAKVRITTTGTPGAGAIRITIHYITLTAPTS